MNAFIGWAHRHPRIYWPLWVLAASAALFALIKEAS